MENEDQQRLPFQRYLVWIGYDGLQYHGSQYQGPNIHTPELVLRHAIARIHPSSKIVASCRTDKGVHALRMAFHIDLPCISRGGEGGLVAIPCPAVEKNLMSSCGQEKDGNVLNVLEVVMVPTSFHARYSACARTYIYIVYSGVPLSLSRSPLCKARAWLRSNTEYDETLLSRCVQIFPGMHDFNLFRFASCGAKSPIRTMRSASVDSSPLPPPYNPTSGRCHVFRFTSQSFLYHQIRLMVGAVIAVVEGVLTLSELTAMLLEGKEPPSGPFTMAPPEGLYLADVQYEDEAFVALPPPLIYRPPSVSRNPDGTLCEVPQEDE